MPAKLVRQDVDSTESWIVPYESLNDLQEKITDETLPGAAFEICDSCNWCATCINEKGVKVACPVCGTLTSKIPMGLDEICISEKEEKRDVTLRFARKLPLR